MIKASLKANFIRDVILFFLKMADPYSRRPFWVTNKILDIIDYRYLGDTTVRFAKMRIYKDVFLDIIRFRNLQCIYSHSQRHAVDSDPRTRDVDDVESSVLPGKRLALSEFS